MGKWSTEFACCEKVSREGAGWLSLGREFHQAGLPTEKQARSGSSEDGLWGRALQESAGWRGSHGTNTVRLNS